MPTNSKEVDLKPQVRNSEYKYLTRSSSSSMAGDTVKRNLEPNGANGDSFVPSQHKPCLQTPGRAKNGKRVMKQKQNKAKVAAAKTEKGKSLAPEPQVPAPASDQEHTPLPDVFDSMLASVSRNPALIRALAIIREDLKLTEDLKHKGPTRNRGSAKGGATSSLKRSPPEKEKDPKGKEKMAEAEGPMETNPRNGAKKMKLITDCSKPF